MSDPVTNADIEDVLAQVRRLVLQGAPAEAPRPVRTTLLRAAQLPAGRPAEPGRPEPRGRLVLTPALRVEGEGEGEEAPTPLRAAPSRGPGQPAPLLLSMPVAQATPAEKGAAAPSAEPDRPPKLSQEPSPEPSPEPSLSWSADLTGHWTLADDLEEEPQDAIEGAAPLVFRHRGPTVPDGPVPDPTDAAAVASASPPPAEAAALALDEERLRAIVLEVVRAELQGELGERITRNLRRLVRREVFRVLESRDEG